MALRFRPESRSFQTSPLEALWDTLMRAINLLPPELRQSARLQLGSLAIQGALAALLLLFVLGGAIATKAALPVLTLLAEPVEV